MMIGEHIQAVVLYDVFVFIHNLIDPLNLLFNKGDRLHKTFNLQFYGSRQLFHFLRNYCH